LSEELMGAVRGAGIALALTLAVLLIPLTAFSTPPLNGAGGWSGAVIAHAQIPRASPNVVTKILGSSINASELMRLLQALNVTPGLGGNGLSNLSALTPSKIFGALASNPNLTASLSSREAAELTTLATQTGGARGAAPPALRTDLSLLASLAHNKELKEILTKWAETGNIDLSDLNKLNLSKLSPQDLAILKAALGLASRYGLVSRQEVSALGLKLTPEDLKALASLAKVMERLSGNLTYSKFWRKFAARASSMASLGNISAGTLKNLLSGVRSNVSIPYMAKVLTQGLEALATTGPPKATFPRLPKLPKLPPLSFNLAPSAKPLPHVSMGSVSSLIRDLLASIAAVLAAYLAYTLLKGRLAQRLGKAAVPALKKGAPPSLPEDTNWKVIEAYWKAVSYLSRFVRLEPCETHREYAGKAYSLGGSAFIELTRLYELARWSGRRLSDSAVETARRILNHIRSRVAGR